MPILKQATREVILPVSKAKVILTELNYGIFVEARRMSKEDQDSPLFMASLIIKDWDLTDEAGVKIPITIENLKKIKDIEDGDFLMSEVADQINKEMDQKKTSKSEL